MSLGEMLVGVVSALVSLRRMLSAQKIVKDPAKCHEANEASVSPVAKKPHKSLPRQTISTFKPS